MKKRIFFIIALLVAFSVTSMAAYQTKKGAIKEGYTALVKPMAFTAADSIRGNGGFHIVTSDSLVILITNPQKFLQYQTFTTSLAYVSGAHAVTIKAYGKVTSGDSWHPIGSAVSWTGTSDNPGIISGTTAKNYNYFRISYVASGATQCVKVTAFEVKTANIFPYAGLAISGAAINMNVSSNYATNVNTGTSTGAVTIGGGSNTVAVSATKWSVSTAGAAKFASQYMINDADSMILNNYKSLRMLDFRVNAASKWYVDSTGNVAAAGKGTFAGGIVTPNASPVIWAKGGSTVLATSGTDAACSNGARYWTEIYIPYNVSLTGIAYLVGSVGGTDSVVVQLCNSAGVEVATSKKTGANHAALVGTAAQFQSCPFYVGSSATPYTAIAGKYYIVVQFNGTTAKFRTYPIPGSKFIANTAAGTWGTKADITPGTSFVADKGPISMTY